MGSPKCRPEVGEEGLQGSRSRDSCQGQEVCVLETVSCGHLMSVEGDPGQEEGSRRSRGHLQPRTPLCHVKQLIHLLSTL